MHTIRIHKPLWGGFPKHWLAGPIDKLRLVESDSEPGKYSEAECELIVPWLSEQFPGAVITRDGL